MATALAQSGYLKEPGGSVLDDQGGSVLDDHFHREASSLLIDIADILIEQNRRRG
jgi:hypothetical protein